MGLRETASHLIGQLSNLGNSDVKAKGVASDGFLGLLTVPNGGSRLTNQQQYMKAYLDWVYAAASTVATDAAAIDYRAYANRSKAKSSRLSKRLINYPDQVLRAVEQRGQKVDSLEELDNHILLDLLDHPNPVMDTQRFHELTFLHLQLAGEAFWGIIRNGLGKPAELWPLVPYNMKHAVGEGGRIVGWSYRVNGVDVPWAAEDVVSVVLPDPNDFYRGMSIVKAAARAIETDQSAADWNRGFFRNSARPDLMLETPHTLTEPVFKRLKEQWEERHQGAGNNGKIAILDAGLKANRTAMTQKEMDFLESRKFSRDEILAMFKVSRVMLGLIEGDGRSNMEAAEYNHAKRVVRPLMARLAAAVNHHLAPQYDRKLIIAFTDPVPADKEFELKERTERLNATHTVNELRKEMGDDPIPGGDVLYVPANLVPLGTAPVAPVAPIETPAGDDEGKKSLGKPRLAASTAARKSESA